VKVPTGAVKCAARCGPTEVVANPRGALVQLAVVILGLGGLVAVGN